MARLDLQLEDLKASTEKHYNKVVQLIRGDTEAKISKDNELFNQLREYLPLLSLLDKDEKTLIIKDEAIVISEDK